MHNVVVNTSMVHMDRKLYSLMSRSLRNHLKHVEGHPKCTCKISDFVIYLYVHCSDVISMYSLFLTQLKSFTGTLKILPCTLFS